MGSVPAPLARVIQELTKLPGVGEKTATRLAFHLTRTERRDVDALAGALTALRDELCTCSRCCALAGEDPCELCSDARRADDVLCLVEESADLAAVERAGSFRGRYHVLGGTLAPLDGVGPDDLHIAPLLRRLGDGVVREVIIATNPTTEGEATAIFVARQLKATGVRVTRIARGLPVGSDLDLADSETILRALEGRREL
jgi:recombination protein RecR